MNNNFWKSSPKDIDLDEIMNEINGIDIERDVKRTINMTFSNSKDNLNQDELCDELTTKEEKNEQSYYSNSYWSRPIEEINISDLLI